MMGSAGREGSLIGSLARGKSDRLGSGMFAGEDDMVVMDKFAFMVEQLRTVGASS